MSIITKYPILTNYIYLGGIVQYAAALSIVCVSFCISLCKFLLWKIPAVDYSSSEASMSAVYTDYFLVEGVEYLSL